MSKIWRLLRCTRAVRRMLRNMTWCILIDETCFVVKCTHVNFSFAILPFPHWHRFCRPRRRTCHQIVDWVVRRVVVHKTSASPASSSVAAKETQREALRYAEHVTPAFSVRDGEADAIRSQTRRKLWNHVEEVRSFMKRSRWTERFFF